MPRLSHSMGATTTEKFPRCLTASRNVQGASGSLAMSLKITTRPSSNALCIGVRATGCGNSETSAPGRTAVVRSRVAACETWPSASTRKIAALSKVTRRSQPSKMRSNTGAASATELLIALRTSPEAFCCSSASCVSLNSRAFSMAIAA